MHTTDGMGDARQSPESVVGLGPASKPSISSLLVAASHCAILKMPQGKERGETRASLW